MLSFQVSITSRVGVLCLSLAQDACLAVGKFPNTSARWKVETHWPSALIRSFVRTKTKHNILYHLTFGKLANLGIVWITSWESSFFSSAIRNISNPDSAAQLWSFLFTAIGKIHALGVPFPQRITNKNGNAHYLLTGGGRGLSTEQQRGNVCGSSKLSEVASNVQPAVTCIDI